MIDAVGLCRQLAGRGFTFFSGVPCSFLDSLINAASRQERYFIAANEGDAVAIASGAGVGGEKGVVLMQNSGLANAVSPLTSLNWTFGLPVLGFVSLRGEPGVADEPQHELMGRITTGMLDLMEIPWEFLAMGEREVPAQLERAAAAVNAGRTFFFVVHKDTFLPTPAIPAAHPAAMRTAIGAATAAVAVPTRFEALQALSSWRQPEEVLIATTGKTGRELYEIADVPGNLYLVGSMGCAGPLGLGLALARPDRRVIVVEGDGALLMRMGNLASIGRYGGRNLLHLVLDNGTHDSTGGQATVSPTVDIPALAAACGYERVVHAGGIGDLLRALDDWRLHPACCFLYMRILPGSKEPLGRPKLGPKQVLERLRRHLREREGGHSR